MRKGPLSRRDVLKGSEAPWRSSLVATKVQASAPAAFRRHA